MLYKMKYMKNGVSGFVLFFIVCVEYLIWVLVFYIFVLVIDMV